MVGLRLPLQPIPIHPGGRQNGLKWRFQEAPSFPCLSSLYLLKVLMCTVFCVNSAILSILWTNVSWVPIHAKLIHTFLNSEWLQNVYAFVIICLVFPRFACVLGQYQRHHTPSRLFRVSFYADSFVVYIFCVFLLRLCYYLSGVSQVRLCIGPESEISYPKSAF